MNKFKQLLLVLLLCAVNVVFAQAPQMFTYQAVVRNASGQLIGNQIVGVKISILQGSVTGLPVYEETHLSTTNTNGLLTISVGNGNVQTGTFSSINWGSGLYFIKSEIDPAGGNNYTLISTTQMMSVPYALHANTADQLTTPFTESQILSISNDTIYLTGGSFVKLPSGFSGDYNDLTNTPTIPTVPTNVSSFTNDAGYITNAEVPTNVSQLTNDAGYLTSFTESQILSISNDTIYLTGGSFVKLPSGFSGDYNDLTNTPTIPTVPTNVSSFTNDAGYITTADVPTSVSQLTNDAGYLTSFTESQVLTISNDTIYLTGGSYVKLPAGVVVPTDVSAFTNDAGYITSADIPASFSGDYNDLTNQPTIPTVPTNVSSFTNDAGYLTSFTESQVLTISNDTIYLTGGSYVKLPAGVVVPTDVSSFTNDAGYITSADIPAGFSGDYNDLTNKPTIPTVPTNVSSFINDAGYITNAEVPTNVSQLTNDAGYLTSFTESQVLTISNDTIYLTGGSYVKLPAGVVVPTYVSAFTNDAGYITSSDIPVGFSGDYNDLTNKPTIPTVPTNVSEFINDAGYITNAEVPTNVSQLTNDAGYLTSFTESQVLTISNDTIYLTGGSYVKLPAGVVVPTDVSAFTNDAGYITNADIPAGFSGDYNDLTNKPTIPIVPTNVSLFTNDAGYITNADVPTNVSQLTNDAGYLTNFTESQILSISNDTIYLTGGSYVKLPNGFSGDYNDLTNKPTIPTVPTNVSEFINDAGYITTADVPTNVSQLINDAGYLTSFTESQVLTISNDTIYLTGGSYVKLPAGVVVPTNISEFTNDAGYITSADIPASFSGDYNDLTNQPTIPTVPTNVSEFINDAGYITTADVPTNVSQLTNDAGYLTSFTESQILSISNDTIYLTGGSFVKLPSGFSGDYNDLTNKPTIPTVPANVSSFMNDAGYITNTAIPTNVSQLVNDANYITIADVPSVIVPTNVSAFTNDAGYITSYTETQNLASVIANGNSAGNSQIKNVNDPTEAKDAVNKKYVDSIYTNVVQPLQNRIDSLQNTLDSISGISSVSDTGRGIINSIFSIGVGKYAHFSKGNLQYNIQKGQWRFAEHQYDMVGYGNGVRLNSYGAYIGNIDLFSDSFNGCDITHQPYMFSSPTGTVHVSSIKENIFEGEYEKYDWGKVDIKNGGNTDVVWRTPLLKEWKYVVNERYNALLLRSNATIIIDGIEYEGKVLLPDNWILPTGCTFVANRTDYSANIYTIETWTLMENNGAVFLPRAGAMGQGESYTEVLFYYHSASRYRYYDCNYNEQYADIVILSAAGVEEYNSCGDIYHKAVPVRLIQDIIYGYEVVKTESNSYLWNGRTYTEDGIYKYDTLSYNGMDSVAVLVLTLNSTSTNSGTASNKTFSVSSTKTVQFSKGNLQYRASDNTWRFAEHQYDAIGTGNSTISSTNSNYIDLFGWGTSGWNSGATAYQPYSTSTTSSNYYVGGSSSNTLIGPYAMADWGVANSISNGGNQPNMWRTMTNDEWTYLLNTRANATQKKGKAIITIGTSQYKGLVLLPDSWTCPFGCIFTAGGNFSSNNYTEEQWAAMEASGAVFLPITGRRNNASISSAATDGYYWTTDVYSTSARCINIYNTTSISQTTASRYYGCSVRLVKDNE